MIIPHYARFVFGKRWGGWAWWSITPLGQTVLWLCYFEQGIDHETYHMFRLIEDMEMFTDMIDLQEATEV